MEKKKELLGKKLRLGMENEDLGFKKWVLEETRVSNRGCEDFEMKR